MSMLDIFEGSPDPIKIKDVENTVIVLSSSGLDSMAVVYQLARQGKHIIPIYIPWKSGGFCSREMSKLMLIYNAMKDKYPNVDVPIIHNRIKLKNKEYRNREFIETVYEDYKDSGITKIGTGEYRGGGPSTWVFWWSVTGADADTDELSEFINKLTDNTWEHITLDNFGIATLKPDRVRIAYDVLGDVIYHTTSCMVYFKTDCGQCYKCIEHHFALMTITGKDLTKYMHDPEEGKWGLQYCVQMNYWEGILRTIIKPKQYFGLDVPVKVALELKRRGL